MSGDEQRGRPGGAGDAASDEAQASSKNPFLDEAEIEIARWRRRRAKPPAGIISAGGVDMARGHASNIRPLEDHARATHEARRVVLTVETDPRRAPTNPRLREGRGESTPAPPSTRDETPVPTRSHDGAASGPNPRALERAALLPGEAPGAAPPPAMPAPAAVQKGNSGLRVAVVVVLLLLVAGVVRRARIHLQSPPETAIRTGRPAPPPPPIVSTEAPVDTAAPVATTAPVEPPEPTAPPPRPSTGPITPASAAPPKPPPAPPPPKPHFKPPFELPEERSR